MRTKLSLFVVVVLLFLSLLVVNCNFELSANELNNYQSSGSITTSQTRAENHPRATDIDWGEIEVVSEPIIGQDLNIGFSFHPEIAVENDKIYVVWADTTSINGAGNDWDIFFRYYDGGNWSEIQVISEPMEGKDYNIAASSAPDIMVENGKIYIVWVDFNDTFGAGTNGEIFFRCNLTGSNWEDIQIVSEPIIGQNSNIGDTYDPEIVIDNSKIYMTWVGDNDTDNSGKDLDIFFRCNITGTNWNDIQIISEPKKNKNFNIGVSQYPDIAVENDNIYITWEDMNDTNRAGTDLDIFYRCNLTGKNWENIQVISEPIFRSNFNVGDSRYPSITVENDNIYVVWQDNDVINNTGTDYDVFYRCNLTGSGWNPIQIISEPIIGKNLNVGDSECPKIVAENNKLFTVWYDFNNTDNAGIDGEIFYRCNISGGNWENIKIISEPVSGENFNSGISRDPDIMVMQGKNHIIWMDTNNTNGAGFDSDIFYKSFFSPLVLSHSNVNPFNGNTDTEFNFKVEYFNLVNNSPKKITVNIDNIEYPMLEINPDDTNFLDGKEYFFNIRTLDIGAHTYQFVAFDGKFTVFTPLKYLPIVHNSVPEIITKDKLIAYEDDYYIVRYEYKDIDETNVGQSIFWKFSTNADWLKFDTSTAILKGTPTNDDVGKYWVNISIDDLIDRDFTNFTLNVININDAPNIITNNTITINEDEYYEIDYEAIDVDTPQNNLNWFMNSNASWLKFNQKSATLSGLPKNDDVGVFWVNISVSDGEYIDFSNFTLNVINVNDPPKILTKEISAAYEDNYYEMEFKAEDVDNAQIDLTWKINTNAQWLNVDDTNSIINGTPTNDDVGEYWINLSATDGEYFDHKNLTLKVINTNDPPEIVAPNIKKATVGELFSIQFEAVDIDPVPTTFSWLLKAYTSNWLSIGPNTGLLIGEPSVIDIGTYWINVSVTDGSGGWDFFNFTLEVLKNNERPTKSNNVPTLSMNTFYGLIWIIIIIIILVSVIILFTLQKQKKEVIKIIERQRDDVIQTVRAELLTTIPSHLTLPGGLKPESKDTLPAQPAVIDQLPEPEIKALPAAAEKEDEEKGNKVGGVPIPQRYQLPKETLTKEQELKLLRERFLRAEITEEIYKRLRFEIDSNDNKEIISSAKEIKK